MATVSSKIQAYLESKDVGELRVSSVTQPDGTVVNYESIGSLQRAQMIASQDEATNAGDYGCIKIAGDM